MPTNGRTGLVIPVPAADGLLELVEARHPGSVRQGVPAHVSLLYPFVGVAELSDRDTEVLRELFLEQEPMRVVFGECYRRGGFVALRPSPLEGLTELTNRTRRRWPDVVPYEGLYGDVEPHLTVALRRDQVDSRIGTVGCGLRLADLRAPRLVSSLAWSRDGRRLASAALLHPLPPPCLLRVSVPPC